MYVYLCIGFVQFRYMATHTYVTNQHTHVSCNAVPLVWGLLRVTPIILSILKEVEIHFWTVQMVKQGESRGQGANTYNHAHFRLLH